MFNNFGLFNILKTVKSRFLPHIIQCFNVTNNIAFQTLFFANPFHNKKHICLPLGTADINAYWQDTVLPGSFTVETTKFAVATFLI